MDNQLKPVLNILSDGNLNSRGIRNFYIETFVVKEVPLTLKMVYNQEFPTNTEDGYITIINDSALVQYNWDNLSQKYVGDYEKSKISETQILTYYPVNNDFLFIKENYTLLKKNLNDKSKRGATLNYLNEVKNGLRNIYE